METPADRLWGIAAEFMEPAQLVQAVTVMRGQGYRWIEAYSPHPIEGLSESLGFSEMYLPLLVFVGGALGGVAGYALQYWTTVISYPLNVAGRPLNSWPMFLPATFECAILAAGLCCVLGMLALNGLPRLHHPLFDVPGFERATQDRYWLLVQSRDPIFSVDAARTSLEGCHPLQVRDVWTV